MGKYYMKIKKKMKSPEIRKILYLDHKYATNIMIKQKKIRFHLYCANNCFAFFSLSRLNSVKRF